MAAKNTTIIPATKMMHTGLPRNAAVKKRVAGYARVSTDSEEQLTSSTTQKKDDTEMIAARTDWEFAGLYADEGISGTRADKRPEFKKMINDCLAGKIDRKLQVQVGHSHGKN